MAPEVLDRAVHVVAGKGGVGRTTVACALALRFAQSGRRTLLLEVNAPDNAAACLGVQPAVDIPREVLNNLWLCRMTPAGSMREYALMVLKSKALYRLVFENDLVKYLLRSIPSLAEFTMLGKAWFHSTEVQNGAPKYERIVIDAPATGHAITFLSVARTVANISPKGVMKDASEKMARMVESSEQTCMHVVCLPEEMPVNEALELITSAKNRLNMAIGLGFVNRLLPTLEPHRAVIDGVEAQAKSQPALLPYVEATRLHLDREAFQREHCRRFEQECELPVVRVPEYGRGGLLGDAPPHERLAALLQESG